jgi:serine/threonine protein kinase
MKIGDVVAGRYTLLRELGKGGIAVVYLAHDAATNRDVALKTIRFEPDTEPKELEYRLNVLTKDLGLAGCLDHLAIVTIYDVISLGNSLCIIMEYIEGMTLAHLLAMQAFRDQQSVLKILLQVARALDYAASKGIVHCGIKPSNIMIVASGVGLEDRVKVVDFGIARERWGPTVRTVTGKPSMVVGTPEYMSPEQVLGLEVDGRTDQFSLAIMAREALTRQSPFTGPGEAAQIQSSLPPAAMPVFQRALSFHRADRYASCEEFVLELEKALQLIATLRTEPVSIFYSYSHEDEDLRRELEAHLAPLRRSGLIREWHDHEIIAGQDWDKEISRYLESANLILFLISPDFINSSYIFNVEVKRAFERESAGDAVVVPVILRPVMWKILPELSRLQALPEGARAVTEWPSRDLAFVSVCEGIFAIIVSKASAPPRKVGVWAMEADGLRRHSAAPRARRRILDAALPARVPLAKPSALLVMIHRTDSPGLRSIVEADPDFDIGTKDIDSQPISLKFPTDKKGIPQPLDLSIRVESPHFEPKLQVKNIRVPPGADSQHRIFLVTPTQSGPLLINLEICRGNEIIAGCLLRTKGVFLDEGPPPPLCVASATLPVSEGLAERRAGAEGSFAGLPLPMPPPPPPSKSRHSRWLSVLTVVATLIFGALAARLVYVQRTTPDLDQTTMCPVNGAKGLIVLLLDATNSISPFQQADLRRHLQDIQETVPEYCALDVYTVSAAKDGLLKSVGASVCNPGYGRNARAFTSNPHVMKEKWKKRFSLPLNAVLASMLVTPPSDQSPILEGIQSVAVAEFGKLPAGTTTRKLIIVSDMLPNTPEYSQYHGIESFDEFRRSSYYRRVRPDLHGVEVELYYLRRDQGPQVKQHIEFWERYFADSGATLVHVVLVQGQQP